MKYIHTKKEKQFVFKRCILTHSFGSLFNNEFDKHFHFIFQLCSSRTLIYPAGCLFWSKFIVLICHQLLNVLQGRNCHNCFLLFIKTDCFSGKQYFYFPVGQVFILLYLIFRNGSVVYFCKCRIASRLKSKSSRHCLVVETLVINR